MRKFPAPALLTGVLALLLSTTLATAGGPTGAPRTRRQTVPATRTAQSSPTPIVVPRLPPATPTPANATTTTPAPQPTQTPAPRPAPSATPAPSANETLDDEDEVVRVTSNLVVVPTSVTDAAGEPVQGLKLADFRLEEEGRAQELSAVGDADQVPLDIAILFDVSSSVTAKNFFQLQQEAAARFLRQVLKPSDRAAVITLGKEPKLVQPLAPAEAATAALLKIPAAEKSEPTAFYDAVGFAAKYLGENAPGRHRRVILAISDGDDNFSTSVREQTIAEYEALKKAEASGGAQGARVAARRDLQARHQRAVAAVQRAVQGADAVFYSVNPGGASVRLNEISTRAQNSMQSVADSTGGTAFVPERAEDLERIFRQVAAELRAQYLVQYLSNSDAPPGKYLRIKVTVPTRPEIKVRARQGYYAARK